MIEPRPCPFCYGINIEYAVDDGDSVREKGSIIFRAVCRSCSAAGPIAKIVLEQTIWPINSEEFVEYAIEKATLKWNERANDLLGSQHTEECCG